MRRRFYAFQLFLLTAAVVSAGKISVIFPKSAEPATLPQRIADARVCICLEHETLDWTEYVKENLNAVVMAMELVDPIRYVIEGYGRNWVDRSEARA
jgi:hypothetical protein